MSRVGHRDVVRFSKGVSLLGTATDMETLADRVTRCLRSLFDSELCSFDLIDLSATQWNTVVTTPTLPLTAKELEILNQHAHEHPILSHAVRHGDPHAIRTSDLLSLRQYRQSAIYHEFFRPHVARMDRQLGFVAKPTHSLTMGVSINRRGRDFSAEDRVLLECLRPHLLAAYLHAVDRERMWREFNQERESLAAAVGGGLCQVDEAGRILWATRHAEPLLSRYFPSDPATFTRLPRALISLLQIAWKNAAPSSLVSPPPSRTWLIGRAHGTLRVQLATGPRLEHWLLWLTEEHQEPSAEELAVRHGLTRREAETLWWVGQSKTNDEIGTLLGISPRTAEKHLERLFAKLNVYNRTAAARIALDKP